MRNCSHGRLLQNPCGDEADIVEVLVSRWRRSLSFL